MTEGSLVAEEFKHELIITTRNLPVNDNFCRDPNFR